MALVYISLFFSCYQSASQTMFILGWWHFHLYITGQESHATSIKPKGRRVYSTHDEAMARVWMQERCWIEDSSSIIQALLPSVWGWAIWVQRGWMKCSYHTDSKVWIWDSNPGLLDQKAMLSLPILTLKKKSMDPNFRTSLKSSLTSILVLLCPRVHLKWVRSGTKF